MRLAVANSSNGAVPVLSFAMAMAVTGLGSHQIGGFGLCYRVEAVAFVVMVGGGGVIAGQKAKIVEDDVSWKISSNFHFRTAASRGHAQVTPEATVFGLIYV